MKSFILVIVAIIVSTSAAHAQSKKQQIQTLEAKLAAANTVIADYKKEFDKTRDLILSYDDFKREFERSLNALTEENESLQEANVYFQDLAISLQAKIDALEAKIEAMRIKK